MKAMKAVVAESPVIEVIVSACAIVPLFSPKATHCTITSATGVPPWTR